MPSYTYTELNTLLIDPNKNPCGNCSGCNPGGNSNDPACCVVLQAEIDRLRLDLQNAIGGIPGGSGSGNEFVFGNTNSKFKPSAFGGSAANALQAAINEFAALGGGLITIQYGRYILDKEVTIPKNAGIRFLGAGYARNRDNGATGVNGGGTTFEAGADLEQMFSFRGDAGNIVQFSNLSVGLIFENIYLNGGNRSNFAVYCLSTDRVFFSFCRIENNKSGSVNLDSLNTQYPISGAAKPGGTYFSNCTLGGQGGKQAIRIKDATQVWIVSNWFENDSGNPPNEWILIDTCDKVKIIGNEFNITSSNGCAVRLVDNPNAPTESITIANNQFACGQSAFDVIDQRTNVESRGLVLSANIYTSCKKQTLFNNIETVYQSGAGSFSPDENARFSFVSATKFNLFSSLSNLVKRQVAFFTGDKKRFEIEVNETPEIADEPGILGAKNRGSNFAINRFNNDGTFAGTALSIDRSNGTINTGGNLNTAESILAGRSFTVGNTTFNSTGNFISNGINGADNGFFLRKAGVDRYFIGTDKTPSSGDRFGSDLFISSFDNLGRFLNVILRYSREIFQFTLDGSVRITKNILVDVKSTVGTTDPNNSQVARISLFDLTVNANGQRTRTIKNSLVRPDSAIHATLSNVSGGIPTVSVDPGVGEYKLVFGNSTNAEISLDCVVIVTVAGNLNSPFL